MTPVLFDGNSTEFNSNGLGRLSDCASCLVTEERNGIYECEFVYPITGAHYKDIELGKIIVVTHDDRRDKQPFIIYRRSAPISGMVVFNAHHVSYLLSNVIIRPFSATTVSGTFTGFKSNAITANPFTFWTNKSSSGTFSMSVPSSCRSLLAGREGSVLDSFGGGDYEFDGYAVKLYANRGNDSGVTIRYGKNMTDLSAETDIMSLYTAVVPYWANVDEAVYGGVVYGTGTSQDSAKIVTMDLSSYFETAPTVAQLESRAQTILDNNKPWIPTVHVKVDFVAMWQTEEYKNIAPLERVRLCDTVTVKYAELGVDVKARVIRTVWNPLLDRYDNIEIGDAQMSFADTIAAETDMKLADIPNTSMMQKAIDHATDLITGGLGGNIVIQYDGNGKPTEILVMDTEDVSTAVHVLRINVNGIGFSSSGIEGPYTSAWTLDGQFVADFITAGHMRFNILQGGTLTLGGVDDGNGTLILLDASGNQVCVLDKNGVQITEGSIRISTGSDGDYCQIKESGFILKIAESELYTSKTTYVNSAYLPANTKLGALRIDALNSSRMATMSPIELSLYHSTAGSSYLNPGAFYLQNSDGSKYINFACHTFETSLIRALFSDIPVDITSDLYVSGTKNRIVKTEDYGERLLYCYEMPSPMFGDIGEGVIADDGKCYVMIDSVFSETVTLNQYQVILQKYGDGDCWVSERKKSYFVVEGTPGMRFAWEMKAKQSDFDQRRLEKRIEEINANNHIDYAGQLEDHINQIKKDREVA